LARDLTSTLRNLAAIPIIATALALWWVADRLAWLSKVTGDGASRIMGPEQ
jgi:hypothetical protein